MTTTAATQERAERNIALVRGYLDAINDWDFAAMEHLLHADISYELPYAPPAFPRVTRGLDAVLAFLRSIPAFAVEENLHDVRVDALAHDADELVAEFRSEMKLANGQPYSNTYVARVTVRDDRILRFAEHFDPVPLIVALGGSIAMPAG